MDPESEKSFYKGKNLRRTIENKILNETLEKVNNFLKQLTFSP